MVQRISTQTHGAAVNRGITAKQDPRKDQTLDSTGTHGEQAAQSLIDGGKAAKDMSDQLAVRARQDALDDSQRELDQAELTYSQQVRELNDAFYETKGENTLIARTAHEEALAGVRAALTGTGSSDAMKERIGLRLEQTENSHRTRVDQYVRQQRETANDDSDAAAIDRSTQDGIGLYNDPVQTQQSHDEIEARIREKAARKGWNEDKIKTETDKHRDAMYLGMIKRARIDGNPATANKVYNANRHNMTPQARTTAQAELKEVGLDQEAADAVKATQDWLDEDTSRTPEQGRKMLREQFSDRVAVMDRVTKRWDAEQKNKRDVKAEAVRPLVEKAMGDLMAKHTKKDGTTDYKAMYEEAKKHGNPFVKPYLRAEIDKQLNRDYKSETHAKRRQADKDAEMALRFAQTAIELAQKKADREGHGIASEEDVVANITSGLTPERAGAAIAEARKLLAGKRRDRGDQRQIGTDKHNADVRARATEDNEAKDMALSFMDEQIKHADRFNPAAGLTAMLNAIEKSEKLSLLGKFHATIQARNHFKETVRLNKQATSEKARFEIMVGKTRGLKGEALRSFLSDISNDEVREEAVRRYDVMQTSIKKANDEANAAAWAGAREAVEFKAIDPRTYAEQLRKDDKHEEADRLAAKMPELRRRYAEVVAGRIYAPASDGTTKSTYATMTPAALARADINENRGKMTEAEYNRVLEWQRGAAASISASEKDQPAFNAGIAAVKQMFPTRRRKGKLIHELTKERQQIVFNHMNAWTAAQLAKGEGKIDPAARAKEARRALLEITYDPPFAFNEVTQTIAEFEQAGIVINELADQQISGQPPQKNRIKMTDHTKFEALYPERAKNFQIVAKANKVEWDDKTRDQVYIAFAMGNEKELRRLLRVPARKRETK